MNIGKIDATATRTIDLEDTRASKSTVFQNARIVTPDAVVTGALRVKDGRIDAIDGSPATKHEQVIDLDGDFLLPGFVDCHTDNLEKHIVARAGVFWDGVSAAMAHDAMVVAGGITTVFDSLCAGEMGKPDRFKAFPMMIDGLRRAQALGVLRADHLLHLRCELVRPNIVAEMAEYLDDPRLVFATILEDSVARDRKRFRFVMGTRGFKKEEEVAAQERESETQSLEVLTERRKALVAAFNEHGIACASHDDTQTWHIAQARELGMTISEFPITQEAADAAADAGMTVIAGGPNVVLGRSHNGFLSMRERASAGKVHVLCSDYVPSSLLPAVFLLGGENGALSLPAAVAMASFEPAETFGLTDRGAIISGRRADLLHVSMNGQSPVLRGVWVEGRRVF